MSSKSSCRTISDPPLPIEWQLDESKLLVGSVTDPRTLPLATRRAMAAKAAAALGSSHCINFEDDAVLEGYMEGMATPSMSWEQMLAAQLRCPEDFANALKLSDAMMQPLGLVTPAAAAAAAPLGPKRRPLSAMHPPRHPRTAAPHHSPQCDASEDHLSLDLEASEDELVVPRAAKRARLPLTHGAGAQLPVISKRHSSMYSTSLDLSGGSDGFGLEGQAISYPSNADDSMSLEMHDARPFTMSYYPEPMLSDEAVEETLKRSTSLWPLVEQQQVQQEDLMQSELWSQPSLLQMQMRSTRQPLQQLELAPHANSRPEAELSLRMEQKDKSFGQDEELVGDWPQGLSCWGIRYFCR